MTLNSAMWAGVSGLSAASQALSNISDNIANVDTIGFKDEGTNFETLVTGEGGASNVGGGVLASNQQLVTTQGTFSQTSSPTDLAISGQGMFVVTQSPAQIGSGTTVEYTRAGSFTPNAQGYLQNAAGLFLQGWLPSSSGVITTNGSSLSSLSPLNIDSINGTVTATTSATVNGNLNASQTVSAGSTDANLLIDAALYNSTAGTQYNGGADGLTPTQQAAIDTVWTNMSATQQTNASTTAGNLSATQITTEGSALAAMSATDITSTAPTSAYDPTANSMTAYNATTGTGVQPDFTIQVPVSDSQGDQHTLQVDLLKSTTANQWYAEVQTVPTSDVTSATGAPAGQIASGIIAFNPDGSIDTAATTLPLSLTMGASNSATAPAANSANWATNFGVNGQTVSLNLSSSSGASGLTQYASANTVSSINTNGTPFGALSSVAIGSTGLVTATFNNGTSRTIGQVAIATFPNEDGLDQVAGDAYEATSAAGNVSLNTAGAGGAGTIQSQALESSTVDLSAEFTKLITTQRAYTASSKVITSADQMVQDLLQIIR